jgi:hypothetical protein
VARLRRFGARPRRAKSRASLRPLRLQHNYRYRTLSVPLFMGVKKQVFNKEGTANIR